MRIPSLAAATVWSMAGLLIAVVVHVSSVLLLPLLATQDAYAKLASVPANAGPQLLSSNAVVNGLPFADRGTLLAACRFDLRASPLRVRLDIDRDALSTVSFHARNGVVFQVLTDRAAFQGRLDVLLGVPAQIDLAEAADTDEAPSEEVRLTAPSREGFVLFRGLASSPAQTAALRRRFAQAVCRSEVQ